MKIFGRPSTSFPIPESIRVQRENPPPIEDHYHARHQIHSLYSRAHPTTADDFICALGSPGAELREMGYLFDLAPDLGHLKVQ